MDAQGLVQELIPNGHAFMIPNDERPPRNFLRRIFENRFWRTIITMIFYAICIYAGSYLNIRDSKCVIATVILHIIMKIYFTVYMN